MMYVTIFLNPYLPKDIILFSHKIVSPQDK